MKKKFIKIFILLAFIGFTLPSYGEEGIDRIHFAQNLSAKQMEKFEEFLHLPTNKAQDFISKFSDEELTKIWDTYKQEKPVKEQRIFWLLEAEANRKADKIASERLFYLYVALLFLGILFFVFIFMIYFRQKKFLQNFEESVGEK